MCDAEGCDPPVVELQLYRHVYRRRHTRSGRSVAGRQERQEWRVQDSSASGPQAARYTVAVQIHSYSASIEGLRSCYSRLKFNGQSWKRPRKIPEFILGTLKKASAAASSGYWLGPPLIRPSVLPFLCAVPRRLRPAAAGSS